MSEQGSSRRGRPQQFSDEELLNAVRHYAREFGRVPTVDDLSKGRPENYPSAGTLVRRFGSFGAAIEKAGFERPKRGRRPSGAALEA